MTTKAAAPVQPADESSLEKKVYSVVDRYKEYLPVENDRYRLAYALYKYVTGEGDEPAITVKTNRLTLEGITEQELADNLAKDLKDLN